MEPLLELVIPGLPIAQPRQRMRVRALRDGRMIAQSYTPADSPANAFKGTIRLRTREIRGKDAPPVEGPVRVEIVAVFPRPSAATKKTWTNPRFPHTSRPDVDNIAKSVLDALLAVLWRDDSQVAHLSVEKWTGAPDEASETRIRVFPIEFETPTKIAVPRVAPQETKGLF